MKINQCALKEMSVEHYYVRSLFNKYFSASSVV